MNLVRIFDLCLINYIRFRKKTELYQPTYNPNKYFIFRSNLKKRKSDDRLSMIYKNLPEKHGSYLDVGSQLGYFVFKISEKGYMSSGIESNSTSFFYATSLSRLNKIKNVSFFNFSLDKNTVDLLPEYDVISILSVYHHMVYFFGKKDADETIKKLVSKCRKTFFFETGEYQEKGFYWTDSLSFMGDNSNDTIKLFLEKFNFKSVEKIGENSTHLTKHKRSFYVCRK